MTAGDPAGRYLAGRVYPPGQEVQTILWRDGPEDRRYPVRWASPGANPEKLKLPAGAESGEAGLVDEDGTIVGTVAVGKAEATAYLWLPGGKSRAMPLPAVNGTKANAFWPESISNGRVAGRAVFDEKNSRSFATMSYDIGRNAYDGLAADFGPPALLAADGSVLGVTVTTPSIVSGTVTTNLPADEGKEYIVSSFSSDGRSAAGYSVTSDDDKVGNEPIWWRCR